jgi:hypothetical protein
MRVMSTTSVNQGQNISNAVAVLKETYKNLNLLFSELDRVGEKEGFVSLTPRFLRWKSDSAHEGWLTDNFIKLYQLEEDPILNESIGLRDGDLYGIEVDLEGEEGYPTLSLIRYQFDYSKWTRIPAISDHWVFWGPFRIEKFFDIYQNDGIWTSVPLEKGKERYWGIQNAAAIDIPLLSIASSEDIKTKIFQQFGSLSIEEF